MKSAWRFNFIKNYKKNKNKKIKRHDLTITGTEIAQQSLNSIQFHCLH